MAELQIPYFGKIAIDKVEEYYSVKSDLEGRELEIDINFEKNKTDEAN